MIDVATYLSSVDFGYRHRGGNVALKCVSRSRSATPTYVLRNELLLTPNIVAIYNSNGTSDPEPLVLPQVLPRLGGRPGRASLPRSIHLLHMTSTVRDLGGLLLLHGCLIESKDFHI